MNLLITTQQYDTSHVYYCDPIKNNVIHDGYFIRIIYSTPLFVSNGINIYIHFNDIATEKYYNKYKCSFNILAHKELIENIRIIEETLLKNANITNKIPLCKIYEQFKNGNIKIFTENDEKDKSPLKLFMLKISGIWITETQYGITYKFSKIGGNIV